MSSIAEVFPHDDPVARFVVAMSMARNDVRHALTRVGEANDKDNPEFGYWVRIATGHFFEAAYALGRWRQVDEVKMFIDRLPEDGREALRQASSAIQKMGPGVLEHSRDRTFHYAYPTSRYQTDEELKDALKGLGGEEARLVVESAEHGLFRLQFTDEVAAALALRKHDPKKIREQLTIARDGAIGFVNFATRIWEEYARIHDLTMDDPVSTDDSSTRLDHDETRGVDREHVREALGEAGERDTGHTGERIDPSRDREAKKRLEEQPPAGDRDAGEGGAPSGEGAPSGAG